jgi:hypothetical protein
MAGAAVSKPKKPKPKSPTARSLEECRKRGWHAGVVEQTIPHTFIKRDLFGIIDIVAITPDGIVGIQATSGTNHAARIAKAQAEPRLSAWLGARATFVVWSWRKGGAKGTRKVWQLREEHIVSGMGQSL